VVKDYLPYHSGIKFDKILRHIWFVAIRTFLFCLADDYSSCFPHVVNLACKAVLAAITDMDFTAENAEDYNPSGTSPDPIVTLRTLVQVVSCTCNIFESFLMDLLQLQIQASSICHQYFSAVLKALEQNDLQLL
jgi:hypothetical protein